MKIHITLVGGQPAPVYHGIIATQPEKVVYIYSKSTEKAKNSLIKEIDLPYEEIELDATDPVLIRTAAESLAEKYKDDEITVNITSGLKSWSHFFGVVFNGCPNAAVVYMDQNNILWNYRSNKATQDFTFDMDALFRLYGNPIENNYKKYSDFTEEDFTAIQQIERIRMFAKKDFKELTSVLDKPKENILRSRPSGHFACSNSNSYVEWEKTTPEQKGFVRIHLERGGDSREVELESEHIVDITFNTSWFELKVARLLSKWSKAQEIRMNCRFPSKEGKDKNEVDIIINTGVKLLFVECKTSIYHSTDIDKFASVMKNYAGMGNKGIFITDSRLDDLKVQKLKDNHLLGFALQNYQSEEEAAEALYQLLDRNHLIINER